MKITLVRPNSRSFPVPPPYMPLGLLYLASSLKKNNYTISVVDLNIVKEDSYWSQVIDTDIIGFTMLPHARSQVFRLINETKIKYPSKKIVLGGCFPENVHEELFNHYPIDAIVAGEGESILIDMCKDLNWERKIYKSEKLLDIDSIPFPAWEYSNFDLWGMQIAKSRPNLDVNGLKIGSLRWSPIVATRGCVGRCIFCTSFNHWDRHVRFRSPENVVDEIEELVTKHNVKLFSFDDDAFPYKQSQCIGICEEILKRNLKIAWKCDTRADVFDKEMLELMKRAGCFMIAIGLESGSQKILDRIKKGINLDKARQAIQNMKEVGILAYALLMIGNPGETEETIMETVQFLKETRPNLYSYVIGVMAIPGSEMQQLTGVSNDYFCSGDGVPLYLKEHTIQELIYYSKKINQIPKDY